MAQRLTEALRRYFTNNARARGLDYVLGGRVRLTYVDDRGLEALVDGTQTYPVDIKVTPNDNGLIVDASCACPYYQENIAACKHIWAALDAAEHAGHFTEVDGPVELVLDGEPADADDVGAWIARRAPRSPAAGATWWPSQPPAPPPPKRRVDPGHQLLSSLESHVHRLADTPPAVFRYADAELMYVFMPARPPSTAVMQVHVYTRTRKSNGDWSKPKPAKLARADVVSAPDSDRAILTRLFGGIYQPTYYGYGGFEASASDAAFGLTEAMIADLVPAIARTGRAFLEIARPAPARADPTRSATQYAPVIDYLPVNWDDGPPWRFTPAVKRTESGWRLDGKLTREEDGTNWLAIADVLAVAPGFVWTRSTIARADFGATTPLVAAIAAAGGVEIADDDAPRLAALLAELGIEPDALPEELRVDRVNIAPTPHLRLRPSRLREQILDADMNFAYGDTILPSSAARTHFDSTHRRLITRRPDDEAAAIVRLGSAGFRRRSDAYTREARFELPAQRLPAVVGPLVASGWVVEAEGGRVRAPRGVKMSVSSGIDWFDLNADVDFGDRTAPLTEVLAALQRRQQTIRLGDGSIGLLPEDWLERYLPLAATAEASNGRLRFRQPQVALLDALLADAAPHAQIDLDAGFARVRDELARMGDVPAVDPPESFHGVLREYQREGLGWLLFLERVGFGGCLADDMGLGKTVMVLALLAGRRDRASSTPPGPALIVVPRSLVHNWMSEAARFAPALRLMDFTTAARDKAALDFRATDVVIATYGTLRRDVIALKEAEFDYVILDEAQAIKNAETASAKAVRLLKGHHRLALTGTPIENHLGELWSLFEFLNPGVLGRSTIFKRATSAVPDPAVIRLLARGLRPFLLRRTKQQVARELPAKTEQTITCELSKPERALYESLRKHYRASVLARVAREGVKRSQMHILEALLRLRQAACHPALVDRTKTWASSAKLDVVLAQVREVIEEGHKALVFSQFTSLLALLRTQLDRDGIVYEYMDGATRRRGDRVKRFQEDPACPLFLISLKAGGLGLNLTAAEYVFLLDPWWNPAVEAQAIDRTHRIGQTREVFAYRLVAGDTIESRILELQDRKRAVADAVLGESAGGLRMLERDDLELLLS